jgi:hypothetical protein
MTNTPPPARAAAGVSRRGFLTRTAATAAAALAAGACSAGGDGAADPDLDGATVAAGIERVAFDSYDTIRTSLLKGRFGAEEPGAIATFVVTAADQHHKAMEAWGAVLAAGGRPAETGPDRTLKPVADIAVTRLTDVVGVARLALQVEDYASQAYLKLLPTLRNPDTVRLAAQVLVVDQQHQAVLRYLLGLYPIGSGMKDPATPGDFAFAPADPQPSLVTG